MPINSVSSNSVIQDLGENMFYVRQFKNYDYAFEKKTF